MAIQRDVDFENLNKNLEEINNKAQTAISTFTVACGNFSKLFIELEERQRKAQKRHHFFMMLLTIIIAICTAFYTFSTIESAKALKKSNQIQLKFLEVETSKIIEK